MAVCPDIYLLPGSSYEEIIAQIQPYTKKVLCVKNGETLIVYDKQEDVPTTFYEEHVSGNTIHYYRCPLTDDVYAFFNNIYSPRKIYGTLNQNGVVVYITSPEPQVDTISKYHVIS